jgi:hypothetical protein
MRQTLSGLIGLCQKLAGNDTSTASQTFFRQRITSRYQLVLSKLPSRFSEITKTFSTVDDQQYYHYPNQFREIKNLIITIDSVDYHLKPIESYEEWTNLNAINFAGGAIPEYYFSRQRDFGIYPIPQDAYTGTLTYELSADGLVRTDYTTGTVTVTENDETVEGAGGMAWSTTTNLEPDDWFVLTDSNGDPRGSWYRVASVTDADTLELESVFEETTEAGATYLIGQSPEIAEELHDLLAYGAVADYYAGFRQDLEKAQMYNNYFWTGDFDKTTRDTGDTRIAGGLLGFLQKNTSRSNSQLVRRRKRFDAKSKVFATTLS